MQHNYSFIYGVTWFGNTHTHRLTELMNSLTLSKMIEYLRVGFVESLCITLILALAALKDAHEHVPTESNWVAPRASIH